MDTRIDEIADGIYRISTFFPDLVAPAGLTINQFVVLAEEPLLVHTGLRQTFPGLVAALRRVVPVQRLRWLSFGHVEADECGALNLVLAVAPHAEVAVGEAGWPGSVDDLSDRPVLHVAPGAKLDLGGRQVRQVPTPHAPHCTEAQVLFEETTGTLLCGDLFAQVGRGPATTTADLVGAALDTESAHPCAAPGPSVPNALRHLARYEPRTVATMHGSAYEGDGAAALLDLADGWDARFGLPSQVGTHERVRSPHG
jgi:flavorubredoxin